MQRSTCVPNREREVAKGPVSGAAATFRSFASLPMSRECGSV
jgi:hypothetical protein